MHHLEAPKGAPFEDHPRVPKKLTVRLALTSSRWEGLVPHKFVGEAKSAPSSRMQVRLLREAASEPSVWELLRFKKRFFPRRKANCTIWKLQKELLLRTTPGSLKSSRLGVILY